MFDLDALGSRNEISYPFGNIVEPATCDDVNLGGFVISFRPLALDSSRGVRLDIDSYRREFRLRRGEIRDTDSWKLERRQHFEEQGSPGRDAFRRGDWEGAMRILEGKRESVLQSVRKDRENRTTFYRVRVVEDPISAYMRWELQSLRMQAECGKPIRVVGSQAVSALETARLLPEVVVLGGVQTLYEIVYANSGVPDYAVRFTNAELVKNWEGFTKELYNTGEDVISYVDRQVARLPPPQS